MLYTATRLAFRGLKISSLPYRQLRKKQQKQAVLLRSSLPYRQLRSIHFMYVPFTAVQAA